MTAIEAFVTRHPERTYFALAFAVSWAGVLVVVGPGGLVGTYRKIHLPYLGIDAHVDPGDRPLAVHEVNGLRIGVQICYDGSFPVSP